MIAAPMGCVVVWNRMAYFGETIAQAGLIGVVFGIALGIDFNLTIVFAALLTALIIWFLSEQRIVPVDSVLGLMHHSLLSVGMIATVMLSDPSIDLIGYLFGNIFTVTPMELVLIYVGVVVVLGTLVLLWTRLIRIAVHHDLATAEGVNSRVVKLAFTMLIATTVALSIKIVGILLVIAFLVVPAVAARPFCSTPEKMAFLSVVISIVNAVFGLALSWQLDTPGGGTIVLVMSFSAAGSLAYSTLCNRSS